MKRHAHPKRCFAHDFHWLSSTRRAFDPQPPEGAGEHAALVACAHKGKDSAWGGEDARGGNGPGWVVECLQVRCASWGAQAGALRTHTKRTSHGRPCFPWDVGEHVGGAVGGPGERGKEEERRGPRGFDRLLDPWGVKEESEVAEGRPRPHKGVPLRHRRLAHALHTTRGVKEEGVRGGKGDDWPPERCVHAASPSTSSTSSRCALCEGVASS